MVFSRLAPTNTKTNIVAKCAERLAWLTGFSGSAGFAVILKDEAAIFVDGRYVLQVRGEIDPKLFTPVDIGETPPSRWLAEHAQAGARIGYDPWVHTPAQIERFTKALGGTNISLVALEHNPIDAIWTDRPPPPLGQISPYPPRYAGASVNAKLARIRKTLHGADALFLSDPHSIAWAFNIRGADIAHTPIPLAFALLPASGRPALYVEAEKISQKTRGALEKFTDIAPPSQLLPIFEKRAPRPKPFSSTRPPRPRNSSKQCAPRAASRALATIPSRFPRRSRMKRSSPAREPPMFATAPR